CTGQDPVAHPGGDCIVIIGSPPSGDNNVQIVHNESVNDSAIAAANVTNLVIDHNKVTNSINYGIVVADGVNTGEVSYNRLEGGVNDGILAANLGCCGSPFGPQNVDFKSNKS